MVKEKQIFSAKQKQGVLIAMQQQNGTDDGVFGFATPEERGRQLSTVISNNFLLAEHTDPLWKWCF